jgi:hypothetical protein
MKLGIGLSIGGSGGSAGGGLPAAPTGFAYLTDSDGNYLVDTDGAYLLGAV